MADIETARGGETYRAPIDDELKGDIRESNRNEQHSGKLERQLKSRHVQFLALSGAIGTGLFIGSGQMLSVAGPLSTCLCYLITGFNLYCVINSLGEMATYLPLPGAVPVYAARYVDEALSFTLGWNYWYQLAIGVPIEVTAACVIVDYWPNGDAIPKAALITIFFVAMILVNCLPVRIYGEAEFVFGAIKLLTIVGLILLMLIITCGGVPSSDGPIGFRFWHPPMLTYLVPGTTGRFLAFWKVFTQATFAYGGSEMVVIAAGETQNPRLNIPKAVRRVFWRITIFYVLSIFLVTLCVSSSDPALLNAINSDSSAKSSTAAASPFVIAIRNAGINAVLPSIINAVVLTSAWSAGNSFFYASTRVLYSAALDGKAPRFLTWTSSPKAGSVPLGAVALTSALGCLSYLNVNNSGADVFFWFSNLSAVSTLLVWASTCVIYLRFHAGLKYHGISRDPLPPSSENNNNNNTQSSIPYKSPFQPYLAYFSICFCVLVALTNGFDCFFPGNFSAKSFIPPYIDIPIFLSLFLGYKLVKGTKFVKVQDMDLWTGKAEIDSLEGTWEERVARNWVERVWFWIA